MKADSMAQAYEENYLYTFEETFLSKNVDTIKSFINLTSFSPAPELILNRFIEENMIPDHFKRDCYKRKLLQCISSSITKIKGNLVQYIKDSLKGTEKKIILGEIYIDTIIKKLYNFLKQETPDLSCTADKYSVLQCVFEIMSGSKNFISRVERLNNEYQEKTLAQQEILFNSLMGKVRERYPEMC